MKHFKFSGIALVAVMLFLTSTPSNALTVKAVEWIPNVRVVFDVQWGPRVTAPDSAWEDFFNSGAIEAVFVGDYGTHLEASIEIDFFGFISEMIFTFATPDRLPQGATFTQIPHVVFDPETCEDCGYNYEPGIFDYMQDSAAIYPGGKKIPGPKGLSLGRHGARFVLGEDYTGYELPDAGSTMTTLGLGLGFLTVVRRRFLFQRG